MPVSVSPAPSSRHRTQATAGLRGPRGMRAPRGDADRREALITAAERVFLRKGYHAATMDDIAASACMSKRTLYQLVESKEQLFTSLLLRHRPDVALPPAHESSAPRDVLFEILSVWAKHILAPSSVALLRLIIADYQHGKSLARLLDRASAKLCKDSLADYLAGLARSGVLMLSNPEEAAQMLFGMAIGNIHGGMLMGIRGAPTRDELEARLHRAIGIFLSGALPR